MGLALYKLFGGGLSTHMHKLNGSHRTLPVVLALVSIVSYVDSMQLMLTCAWACAAVRS